MHVQHSTQFIRPLKAHAPHRVVVLQLHAELYPQNNLHAIERRLAAADLIVSVSDYITDKTREQLPRLADRCHTLWNGIDPDEFTVAKDHRNRTGPLTIMYAGSVSPHKGLHLLIEAYARVAAVVSRHEARDRRTVTHGRTVRDLPDGRSGTRARDLAPLRRRLHRAAARVDPRAS